MNERLAEIEDRYLGQSIEEFLANDGDPREYARQVFAGEIFGANENPAAPDLDVNTEEDLASALEQLAASVDARASA